MAESSWDNTLEEWLLAEGFCCAASLANLTDGELYAAAPVAGEQGWAMMHADEGEREVLAGEGESTTKVWIKEADCIRCVAEGGTPPNGLWIAGEKYRILRQETHDISGEQVRVTLARLGKKGIVFCNTKTQVIVAKYDESISDKQVVGNATKAIMNFAEYLIRDMGY